MNVFFFNFIFAGIVHALFMLMRDREIKFNTMWIWSTTTYSNDIVNEGFYANDIPTRNATMIYAATNLGDC